MIRRRCGFSSGVFTLSSQLKHSGLPQAVVICLEACEFGSDGGVESLEERGSLGDIAPLDLAKGVAEKLRL